MPYFREWDYSISHFGATTDWPGTFPIIQKASIQMTARYKRGKGRVFDVIPDTVAEPYSWFLDSYQEMKKLNLSKERGRNFDTSSIKTDRGHPWDLLKFERTGGTFSGTNPIPGQSPRVYKDLEILTGGNYQGFYVPSRGNLDAYAQAIWGKAAPTTEVFNLAAFLGELREGLPGIIPALLKKKSHQLKSVGDDYLNVQFGWKPFLSDLQNAAKALAMASSALNAPVNPLHRRRQSQPVMVGNDYSQTKAFSVGSTALPKVDTGTLTGLARLDSIIRTDYPDWQYTNSTTNLQGDVWNGQALNSSMWFEGEFIYLPKIGFDDKNFFDRLDALLAKDITPSVLWELTPWSWLLDWFLKIQDSLYANEIAFSNRILSTYAYAMERIEATHVNVVSNIRVRTDSLPMYVGSYVGPKSWQAVYKTSSKRRIRANPFGFTVNPTTALNVAQMGILGALGLTKTRR